MSNHARPLLFGYVRSDILRNGADLPQARAQLEAFADREEFSLGTVYVAQGDASAAFHALMGELIRDEAAWGVVIPDLRHMTVIEQLVLTCYERGARTAIFAAFSPHSGGPGVGSPTRARPAVPPLPNASSGQSTSPRRHRLAPAVRGLPELPSTRAPHHGWGEFG